MAFHLHRDGRAVEFPLDKLKTMARGGELARDEYVYDDHKEEWLGAAMVPELQGAWDLEEDEATVAMQLPADFLDRFDEEQAAPGRTGPDDPTTMEPAPAPAPMVTPLTVPEPASDEAATRAMDLAELEGQLAPSSRGQQEATVAMDTPLVAPEPEPIRPRRPQPRPAPRPAVPARRRPGRPTGKRVNGVLAAVLSLLTCGLYSYYWMWRVSKEVNAFRGREELPIWVVPALVVGGLLVGGGLGVVTGGLGSPLGVLLVLAAIAWWAHKLGGIVAEMAAQSRLSIGDRKVVYAVCAIFTPVLIFLAQEDLNTVWKAKGESRG